MIILSTILSDKNVHFRKYFKECVKVTLVKYY